MNRHEAIHAIGSVLAEHAWEIMKEDEVLPDPNDAYFAALDELTVESWHEAYRSRIRNLSTVTIATGKRFARLSKSLSPVTR